MPKECVKRKIKAGMSRKDAVKACYESVEDFYKKTLRKAKYPDKSDLLGPTEQRIKSDRLLKKSIERQYPKLRKVVVKKRRKKAKSKEKGY